MSESPPAKQQVPPATPLNKQPPPHNGNTRILHDGSEGPLGGHAKADVVTDAVDEEFKPCTTVLPNGLEHYNALFDHHGVSKAVAQRIRAALPVKVFSKNRWQMGLPVTAGVEKELYPPFEAIFNYIFDQIPTDPTLPYNRRWACDSANEPQEQAKDAQSTLRKPDSPINTRPDVFIFGEDPRLLPANISFTRYESAIVIGEMKPEKKMPQKGERTRKSLRVQLGTYARQCFLQQHNRHFIVGYGITEDRFKFVLYDRAGPTEYPWIKIHENAVVFIQCVMLMAGQDLQKMGFDPTIYYNENGVRCIDVINAKTPEYKHSESPNPAAQPLEFETITFENVRPLYHSRSIKGPGEMGWAGKKKGSPPNAPEQLIIDLWVHKEREEEIKIVEKIEAAKVVGVVHLDYYQSRNEQITTNKARFGNRAIVLQTNGEEPHNMIFTRVATAMYPPITDFESKIELLEVVRDAVKVHRDLLNKANVLHRDLNLNTIRIDRSGARKARLSNFSIAKTIGTGGSAPLVDKDLLVMPLVFQAIHLLKGACKGAPLRTHDFLDPLESVVHILCYVFMEYDGAGDSHRIDPHDRRPLVIEYESSARRSFREKESVMCGRMFRTEQTENTLTPYFNDRDIFTTLLDELASVLWPHCEKKATKRWKVIDDVTRNKIYKDFIQKFDDAIKEINKPLKTATGASATVKEPESVLLPKLASTTKAEAVQISDTLAPGAAPESVEVGGVNDSAGQPQPKIAGCQNEEHAQGTGTKPPPLSASGETSLPPIIESEEAEDEGAAGSAAVEEPMATEVTVGQERVEEEIKIDDRTDVGSKRKQRADEEKVEDKKPAPVVHKRAKPTEEDSGEE